MSNYEHFCSCDTGDELGCRGKGFYDGWGMCCSDSYSALSILSDCDSD